MKKQKIIERRFAVWNLHIKGYTQTQIAEKLNISTKTVARDIHILKKDTRNWFNNLRYGEIQFYYKNNYDSIQKTIHELWQIYDKTEDEDKKLKLLNLIAQKSQMSTNMIKNSYTTHCY